MAKLRLGDVNKGDKNMNREFLYEMLDTMSVSGHEIGLQKKVIKEMKPYADAIRTDKTGNVRMRLPAHEDYVNQPADSFLGVLWFLYPKSRPPADRLSVS